MTGVCSIPLVAGVPLPAELLIVHSERLLRHGSTLRQGMLLLPDVLDGSHQCPKSCRRRSFYERGELPCQAIKGPLETRSRSHHQIIDTAALGDGETFDVALAKEAIVHLDSKIRVDIADRRQLAGDRICL
jgi:hypothetical protein